MGNQLIQNQIQRGTQEKWNSLSLKRMGLVFILLFWGNAIGSAFAAESPVKSQPNQRPPAFLKLSLDDALALFLKQNLNLLSCEIWN